MSDIFEQPAYSGPQALLDAIARDDLEVLRPMIIAAALYDEDSTFVENVCERLSEHSDETVRGNAILAYDRVARLFGDVSTRGIERIRGALRDPSSYVRGQANAAANDLADFLGVEVCSPTDAGEEQ